MNEGKLAKFRVNPGLYNPHLRERECHKYYYHIHVFSEAEFMWRFGKKLRKGYREGYQATVLPFTREKVVNRKIIKAPKIGDVLLYKDFLSSIVVTHEAVHMSTHFLRTLGKLKLNESGIDDGEEMLAYCIGNCTSAIYKGLYTLGIL